MTDRVHSITVVFEDNVREDDVDQYIACFLMMKGVAAAQKNVVDRDNYAAREQAKHELRMKILDLLRRT